uniref:Uncharacterized protein n=1 Tax=Arundo donax TaxID=35708 RepID=A0A0A9FW54_ARUDO
MISLALSSLYVINRQQHINIRNSQTAHDSSLVADQKNNGTLHSMKCS